MLLWSKSCIHSSQTKTRQHALIFPPA